MKSWALHLIFLFIVLLFYSLHNLISNYNIGFSTFTSENWYSLIWRKIRDSGNFVQDLTSKLFFIHDPLQSG